MTEDQADKIIQQLERQNTLLELLCTNGCGCVSRDSLPYTPDPEFK